MTTLFSRIRYLFIQFVFGAMWLALIAVVFLTTLIVVDTPPRVQGGAAGIILTLAAAVSLFWSLGKMKRTAESENPKFAPHLRDLAFAGAVMLAAFIGNLESGGCFAYHSADGTMFVDCGSGYRPIDPKNIAFWP